MYTCLCTNNMRVWACVCVGVRVCVHRNVSDSWLHEESGGKSWHFYRPRYVRCAPGLGRQLQTPQQRRFSSRFVYVQSKLKHEYANVYLCTYIFMYIHMYTHASGIRVTTPVRRCGLHWWWKWGVWGRGNARSAWTHNVHWKGSMFDVLRHAGYPVLYKSCHADECRTANVVSSWWMRHVTMMNAHHIVSDHPQQSCFDARMPQGSSSPRPCCPELDHERMSVKLDVVQKWLYCNVCMCLRMVICDEDRDRR